MYAIALSILLAAAPGASSECQPGAAPALCVLSEPYAKTSCDAPEHRQFDFWIGTWEVVDTTGAVLGRNMITREQGGCVLHERWTGASGVTGESFNIYDRTTRQWHQSWVDSTGTLLLLSGGFEGGSMVLRGQTRGAEGAVQQQRITFTPRADGAVTQRWEASGDGTIWQTVFHGIYRRAPEPGR